MAHPFNEYPKHLHNGKDAPKIVYNAEDEAAARKDGYQDDYIPQGSQSNPKGQDDAGNHPNAKNDFGQPVAQTE